jgi:hypothetical protein
VSVEKAVLAAHWLKMKEVLVVLVGLPRRAMPTYSDWFEIYDGQPIRACETTAPHDVGDTARANGWEVLRRSRDNGSRIGS